MLLVEPTRAVHGFEVDDPQETRIVFAFDLENRVRVPVNAECSRVLDGGVEHFGHFVGELGRPHQRVLVAASFKRAVLLPDVRREQLDRVEVAGLFQPPVHRLTDI